MRTTAAQKRRKIRFRDVGAGLPDAPESWGWNAGISDTGWGNWWNSELGDCGPEAWYHAVMSRWAAKQIQDTIDPEDVLAWYETAGGYRPGRPWTDGGVNNPTMIQDGIESGYPLNGRIVKLDGTASIDPGDFASFNRAGFNLGGLLLGINLSQTCYDNFGPGNVWDVDGSELVGGHDVWCPCADAEGPQIVTWGQLTQCTWAWVETYCDDIDVLLDVATLTAGGSVPDGMDVAAWKNAAEAYCGMAAA